MEKFLKDYMYLTFSEKKFVKETIEILKIFQPDIIENIENFLREIDKLEKNKFKRGKVFFNYIFSLRYPVLSSKLIQLKKLKEKLKYEGINLNIPENIEVENFNLQTEKEEVKNVIIEMNRILSSEI